ncbi:choice-of-anchor P family protein [Nocardioides sp. WS12]|uniref:choice-of-anchor P family protein n=1 Tax=Nocardioides sp. WS12 TaxID=2486272 RepID=UPI0015FDE728|nr:choice-of-anchor P family protein [Nocardioides sp. WS12]
MRALRILLAGAVSAAGLTAVAAPPAVAANATVSGFSQCANGTGTALTCAGGWINGAIQNSNSHYNEDQVVPQRALLSLPADNAEHSLTFTYQDRKGNVHAYDSLATWNKTVSDADPCQSLAASLCAGAPSTLPMATDGANIPPSVSPISTAVSAHQLPAADRMWTLYGGVLTSDAVISHSSPTSGDDLVTVTVRFRNATPTVARDVVLLFGGHLAVGGPNTLPRAWGLNLGASSVSGGPYAFKLEQIDGGSTGATANTIQASATGPVPPPLFSITKTANPTTAAPGDTVNYTVTVKNTGGQPASTTFTDDHADNITPSAVTSNPSGGTCTPAGTTNKVLNCTTSSIAAGASQVFTYSAVMPGSFTSGPGSGCGTGLFPITNTATLTGGSVLAGSGTATATVCVNAAASFTVDKAASNLLPGPGQTITYTLTVKNTGTAPGATTVVDDYDNRLDASITAPAGCTKADGKLTCTTGSILPGLTQVFTYTATMPATFEGDDHTGCASDRYPVKNTASIGTSSTDTVIVCVQAGATFTVTKVANDLTATPGQLIEYTITVKNTGNASGSTTFVDNYDDRLDPTVPAGCTKAGGQLSCNSGTIAAGLTKTFVYSANMPTSFSGSVGNCAANSYPVLNTVTLANSQAATVQVCVGAAANFTITKDVNDDTPIPGQTVTYTVKVKNEGAAAGSTSFTDVYDPRMVVTFPSGCSGSSGTFTCQTGSVAAGETVTFTYTAVVPSAFGPTSGGENCASGTYPLKNTATVLNGPGATEILCVAAAPNLSVTKSVNDTTGVPNQVLTYTITVKNTGNAAGTTSFVDNFDDRLSPTNITRTPDTGSCEIVGTTAKTLNCSTGTIPAGEQQVFTYQVTLPATYATENGEGVCNPGTYLVANSVNLGNGLGSASVNVCVAAAPNFLVEKTIDNSNPAPGDTVTYTIKVTNNGTASGSTTWSDDYDNRLSPSTATSNPAGNNCVPAGGAFTACATGVINALGQQTFVYTAQIPDTFTGTTGNCLPGTFEIYNKVVLGSGASDDVSLCVTAAPEFDVTKSVDDTDVAPGDTVTYTLKVDNFGTSSGSTTIVDDYDNRLDPTVPAGCTKAGGKLTCTTGTILAGDSKSFVYTAVIPTSFTGADGAGDCDPGEFDIVNSVTVSGTTAADSVTLCVPALPKFSVVKTANDTSVGAGDLVTYTVTVKNIGAAPGSSDFTDDFDDRLAPSSAVSTPAGNDCAPSESDGNELFDCTTASLDPGQSQKFVYSAAMPDAFTDDDDTCEGGGFAIVNSVSVVGDTDAVTICVAAAPEFTITKSPSSSTAMPGGSVGYDITVTNIGTAEGSTTFTDQADATIAAAPAGCELVSAHSLSCTTRSLEAGEDQVFTYQATVPATYTGEPDVEDCDPPAYPVRNRATLANGDVADAVVCVGAAPDFTVEKTVDDATGVPGQTVHYTLTVTNNGAAAGSTTLVDDYDNRLTPTIPAGCSAAGGLLTCTTGVLLSGGEQEFTYDAVLPATYSGTSGVEPCQAGEYPVANLVRIDGEVVADETVCVAAAPEFTVDKSADDVTATPGQVITYKVTVRNTGSVAGSTTFSDDYDSRLNPSVPAGCSAVGGVLTCTTAVIEPDDEQVITYTAAMPASFTGPSGLGGCATGTFPVANGVVLANGTNDAVTVCVAATSNLKLTKTSSVDHRPNGDQVLTYTITWINNGPAEALQVVLTDAIPAGTQFVSCTAGCSLVGSPATATWNLGAIAPLGGTGSVTLVVKLVSNQICTVPNSAKIKVGNETAISSNTVTDNVTPQPDPSTAKSNGAAIGVQVKTSGILTLITGLANAVITNNSTVAISNAASSQTGVGGPTTNSDSLLSLSLGGLLTAGVISTTSSSSVTAAPAEARQTTTAEVAGVCLVPVAGLCTVQTGTVRAVASTMANGYYASATSTGSTIQNLKIAGLATPVDLNQTTTIPLNPLVFGKNSYVAINERTSSTGLSGGKYVADQTVAMIHVKITGLLLIQAAEIYVAKATAHSEFAKTFVCSGAGTRSVSGHAYTARVYTGPLLADLLQGYVQISPLGGAESEHVAAVALPAGGGVVGAKVADSSSSGSFNSSSATATSWAEVAGDGPTPVCVLGCTVRATAVRSQANSNGSASGSTSTSAGTSLLGLQIAGLAPLAANPAPNTTLVLPGIGFIILNEQFCDGGGAANGSCSGPGHSGITVRAVRVVVTVANNILGLSPGIEVVVAEAHADTTFQ